MAADGLHFVLVHGGAHAGSCWERLVPELEASSAVALPEGLPCTYVLLERDEALPPAYQREQAATATAGAGRIVPFDAGHSAFVSRPRELAALLVSISSSAAGL